MNFFGGAYKVSKKLFKVCLILLISIQFIFSSPVFAESENLVKNPGFEEGNDESVYFWQTHCWEKAEGVTEFFIDESVYHSGGKSACIVNHSENDSRYMQPIKVKGDTYYRLSCWVKTENVGTKTKGANISIEGSLDTSRDIRETSDNWEYLELYGKTSPNQETFTLTIGLGGYGNTNTGKIWIDDVEVVELESLPAGKTAINLDPKYTGGNQNTSENTGGKIFMIFIALIFFLILLAVIFVIFFKDKMPGFNAKAAQTDKPAAKKNQKDDDEKWIKVKFDKIDFIIMGVMTLVYLCVALYNLGDFKVPTTSWEPTLPGEYFTVDLGKEATLSRIYYYCGLGSNKYNPFSKLRVEYLNENQEFEYLATIDKKELQDIFKWKYVDTAPVTTTQLKFIVDSTGGAFNEIAIVEQNSKEPLKNIKIIDSVLEDESKATIGNLFDEPDKFAFKPSYMNGMYFDEIYHARTAFEHIHRMSPYETTHPPLGKIFIALGILVFGMVPFGWRIVGTLFGVAMVPVMYMFGKKVFHDRFYAFCTAFLMMFDFMHFSQTRIATIDSYVTLFVILMYYHMYDYFINKSYNTTLKESLKPLFLSGLFFGLGAASKWIAIYGAAGLALLFFVNKGTEFWEYRKISTGKSKKKPLWIGDYPSNLGITIGACVLFFIIIPLVIYILSYIPYMLVPGDNKGITVFIENSKHMFEYHSKLEAEHPYQSAWWEWPIMAKPMAFYFGSDLEPGMTSKIFTMGNPAVWWVGLLALLIVAIFALSKVNKNLVVLFTLAATTFGYVALPKTIFTETLKAQSAELCWAVIFFALIAILLVLSKLDTDILITSAVSSVAFGTILYLFKDIERGDAYLKSGNTQLIIWACLLICITLLFIGIYRYDKKMMVPLAGLIFQYVPWIAVPRIAFIYHYFSIVPFLILLIVYVIKKAADKHSGVKYFACVYLGIVMALFILFYPGLSGLEVPISYMRYLKWFNTWYF